MSSRQASSAGRAGGKSAVSGGASVSVNSVAKLRDCLAGYNAAVVRVLEAGNAADGAGLGAALGGDLSNQRSGSTDATPFLTSASTSLYAALTLADPAVTTIITRQAPSISQDSAVVQDAMQAVRKMTSLSDMQLLGDQLLLDRLGMLTEAFFSYDGTSLAHLEMRAEATERVQALHDAAQTAAYLQALDRDKRLLHWVDLEIFAGAVLPLLLSPPALFKMLADNVPTVLFWALVVAAVGVYLHLQGPLVVLLSAVFLVPVPDRLEAGEGGVGAK